MIADLVDCLFLTGLVKGTGPSVRTVLTVHVTGTAVGCVLGLLAGIGAWPLLGGAAAAAGITALSALFLGETAAAPALAAAFVEVTTYFCVRLVLVVLHTVLA